MHEYRRLQVRGRLPESIERGVVEISCIAFRQSTDHHSAETLVERFAQHFGGEPAVLQRHRREGSKAGFLAQFLLQAVVVEAAPGEALACGELVAEAVEPPAHELMVDAVPVHPGAPVGGIGELGRDRPRRLPAGELQAYPFAVAKELHPGKLRDIRVVALVEQLRDEVRMDVDDDVFHVSLGVMSC